MKTIPFKIYNGGGIDCLSETCKFKRECANHRTAGDFRSEDGFSPELVSKDGEIFCITQEHEADGRYPANADELGRGSLCVGDISPLTAVKELSAAIDSIHNLADKISQRENVTSDMLDHIKLIKEYAKNFTESLNKRIERDAAKEIPIR